MSLGLMSPHITPVPSENQLCPLRFSVCIYPQQGNFHQEHCKEGWLASHVFVILTSTHITPVKKKRNNKKTCCFVRVASLFTVAVRLISLCVLCSLCVFLYTLVIFHRFIFFYLIYNTELFICYVILIHNRAGPFHLLLPSV